MTKAKQKELDRLTGRIVKYLFRIQYILGSNYLKKEYESILFEELYQRGFKLGKPLFTSPERILN